MKYFYSTITFFFLINLYPEFAQSQSPSNDNICNAQELIIGAAPITGDNTNASSEPGEPIGSCFLEAIVDVSVWYYFVPANTGNFEVTTDLAVLNNDDTQLAAYYSNTDCSGTLSEIACNEDVSNSNYLSTMFIQGATAGDTVWVQVDGWGPNGGLTGTFQIQVVSIPALPFDVSIENTSIVATGMAGYNLVPFSQSTNSAFKINVNNVGQNPVSNVVISGTINPGNDSINASSTGISEFSTENLSTTSMSAITSGSVYSANFNVSLNENDGDLSNNSESITFIAGALGDTVFSLENASAPSAGHGGIVPTSLGNRYEFTSPDTITSVSIYLVNPSVSNFAVSIHSFDPVSNTMLGNLWTTGIIPIPGPGFHTYSSNLPVSPGSYLISVLQPGNSSITLGMTNQVHRNNTSFFGSPNGQSLFALEELNLTNTYMIRANLNTQINQTLSLAAFDLLSPPNGSRIASLNSNPSINKTFSWTASGNSLGTSIVYNWYLDFQGANFSNPIAKVLSGNNGADTSINLSYSTVDSIIESLGVQLGDSISLAWKVEASFGNNAIDATNGPFNIKFVREFVSNIASIAQNSIEIVPNPSKGLFSIKMSAFNKSPFRVNVFDLNGVLRKSYFQISGKSKEIDCKNLPSGVYILEVESDKTSITEKIIIE